MKLCNARLLADLSCPGRPSFLCALKFDQETQVDRFVEYYDGLFRIILASENFFPSTGLTAGSFNVFHHSSRLDQRMQGETIRAEAVMTRRHLVFVGESCVLSLDD